MDLSQSLMPGSHLAMPPEVVATVRKIATGRQKPFLFVSIVNNSGSVIWYAVRRAALLLLITVPLVAPLSKRTAAASGLLGLVHTASFLLERRSFQVLFVAELLCCCLFLADWTPSLICAGLHAWNPVPFDAREAFPRRVLRHWTLATVLEACAQLMLTKRFQARTFVQLATCVLVVNVAEHMASACLRFLPCRLDIGDVINELRVGNELGEFLALYSLTERSRIPMERDDALYAVDVWPDLVECLLARPTCEKVRVLCTLVARSYKLDSRGVVQLKLGPLLERLIDLREQARLDGFESQDLYYELSAGLRLVALKFGKDIENCDVSAAHLRTLRHLSVLRS